ncbi:Gfo/Idh/MocA family protein [Paenibacillus nasutitermitis]|uniref:Oxidoreductase n=1 Tax=Paenibacillus nasutitermitis TaxID=1652958 RepID=A0A916ZHM2_9BACL|nr:Gfo/Idh/MocA family oxidoreductase [Paenibacillus nasutitermitis]GGD98413.1 oxidoreductase [Paenibacillus nasutitermitis]
MSEALRIGVIGCGDIAASRHIPAIMACPDVQLAALCDADLMRAQQLAGQYQVPLVTEDYRELLQSESLDAVIICTPPWVTPHLTMESLQAGKHVLCEKPMAVDLVTAKKVQATELATGCKVQVGFTYRHGPLLETLRQWIREGRLGSPLVYRLGIFDEVWDPEGNKEHYDRIYRTMQHGSPSIHDGAHVADFLHFLTDSAVASVDAYGIRTRPEFPATNYDLSMIHYENGDIARVEIGWFLPHFPNGEFEVVGPKGIAIFDRFAQYVQLKTDKLTETVKLEEDWAASCFRIQLDKFIASIRMDTPCVPGTAEGIASLALTKQIEQGIRNNHN